MGPRSHDARCAVAPGFVEAHAGESPHKNRVAAGNRQVRDTDRPGNQPSTTTGCAHLPWPCTWRCRPARRIPAPIAQHIPGHADGDRHAAEQDPVQRATRPGLDALTGVERGQQKRWPTNQQKPSPYRPNTSTPRTPRCAMRAKVAQHPVQPEVAQLVVNAFEVVDPARPGTEESCFHRPAALLFQGRQMGGG